MATATKAELWVGTTTISAATISASDFTTWTALNTTSEVSRVGTIGELGDSVEAVTITDLKDGRTRRVPGAIDGGEISVVITQIEPTNSGQTTVRDNDNTANTLAWVIKDTVQDQAQYFEGLAANYMENERAPSVNLGATFTIYRNEAVKTFDPTT